jgi:hypothetical protein
MEQTLLLAELRGLSANIPSFEDYSPISIPHAEWVGKAHALVQRWSSSDALAVQASADLMSSSLLRDSSLAKIVNTIHRAIADLEIRVGSSRGGAFGPGAVYDMLRALRELLASASTDVLIVDPYMDAEIFDAYISAVADSVAVKLLLARSANSVRPAMNAYSKQHATRLEARSSTTLHDRVVFIDRRSSYVLGQSIKDAAKNKPTYLAPLAPDVSRLKLLMYESIWSQASAL